MDKQPASNFNAILKDFAHLIQEYDNLAIEEPRIRIKRKRSSMEVYYPLKEHPIYGVTVLYAYEKYDEEGYILRYMYNWYTMYPKSGKHQKHISSWENEPHDDPNTPEEFRVSSEPHHHHHTPGNRKNRQSSFHVRSVEDVFFHIQSFLMTGEEYLHNLNETESMIESTPSSSTNDLSYLTEITEIMLKKNLSSTTNITSDLAEIAAIFFKRNLSSTTNIISDITKVSEIMFDMFSELLSYLPPAAIKNAIQIKIKICLNYPEENQFRILGKNTDNFLIFYRSQFCLIKRRK